MKKGLCFCCKKFKKLDKHHIDYIFEKTVYVCEKCHVKIHYKNYFAELKPTTKSTFDKIAFNFTLSPKLHLALKLKAIKENKTMQEIAIKAIKKWCDYDES